MLPFPVTCRVGRTGSLWLSLTRPFSECEIARRVIDFRMKIKSRQVVESLTLSGSRLSGFISLLQARSRLFNQISGAGCEMVEI
jgi:hypothetical protein